MLGSYQKVEEHELDPPVVLSSEHGQGLTFSEVPITSEHFHDRYEFKLPCRLISLKHIPIILYFPSYLITNYNTKDNIMQLLPVKGEPLRP